MRRNPILIFTVLLLVSSVVQCQEDRHSSLIKKPGPKLDLSITRGKFMEFPSATGTGRGYLALPDDKNAKHPAMIVIQEWWGVDDWIMQQADRFAKQGYVTLAVDLYRGKVAKTQDEAHELMRGLPEDRALADMKAGFNLLAA